MSIDYGKFISDDLSEIPESPISELSRKSQEYDDSISLGRGEPDFDMADFMKDAMTEAVNENKTHYAASGSVPGLNEELAKKLKGENHIEVDPKFGIVVGSGSSAVLQSIMGTILLPGDQIILTDPTYLMYISLVKSMHISPNFVPIFENNNFAPTIEDLEKVWTEKTKAIVVNSPSNPTGAVYSKDQLEEICDFAVDKDLMIVSDEIYENITYDGAKHHSIGSFDGMFERTITVNGFSKSYAMTGLRVGYAAGPNEIMKEIFKYNYFGHICACVPSMYAALEGLRNPKTRNFIDSQVRDYDKRRKYILERLDDIGLETKRPKGAFYAFSNCKKFNENSYELANDILEKVHVVTTPGSAFGPHGEGFLRFSYATKYEKIAEAMDRLEKFFEQEY